MKSRRVLGALLIACLLSLGTAHAGPAAEKGSLLAVRGVQVFMTGQPERFDPECVSAIPDGILAGVIAPLLEARLTPPELRQLDAFFSSDLGQRINEDFAARQWKRPGYVPVKFSEAEQKLAASTLGSSAADKYFSLASVLNPDLASEAQALLEPHMQRCARAP